MRMSIIALLSLLTVPAFASCTEADIDSRRDALQEAILEAAQKNPKAVSAWSDADVREANALKEKAKNDAVAAGNTDSACDILDRKIMEVKEISK